MKKASWRLFFVSCLNDICWPFSHLACTFWTCTMPELRLQTGSPRIGAAEVHFKNRWNTIEKIPWGPKSVTMTCQKEFYHLCWHWILSFNPLDHICSPRDGVRPVDHMSHLCLNPPLLCSRLKTSPCQLPARPTKVKKKWGKICFKKLPLGPPSLPVIGSYPFLSGPGIERLFGTQVRLRTNAIGSIAVSHTGLLLWPNHGHVHGLLPSRRRERLAARKKPLCKRGVLGQNQVGWYKVCLI